MSMKKLVFQGVILLYMIYSDRYIVHYTGCIKKKFTPKISAILDSSHNCENFQYSFVVWPFWYIQEQNYFQN